MNDFFEAFNVGAAQSDYPHAPGLPQPDYAENTWPDVRGSGRRSRPGSPRPPASPAR